MDCLIKTIKSLKCTQLNFWHETDQICDFRAGKHVRGHNQVIVDTVLGKTLPKSLGWGRSPGSTTPDLAEPQLVLL